MSYSNPDPYNQPEAFGLEQLALLDFSDGSYCFDYRVVWRHKESGRFYTARDNGCSCPSPFEDYHSIDDLAAASFSELETEINEELAKDHKNIKPLEAQDFLDDLRKAGVE